MSWLDQQEHRRDDSDDIYERGQLIAQMGTEIERLNDILEELAALAVLFDPVPFKKRAGAVLEAEFQRRKDALPESNDG